MKAISGKRLCQLLEEKGWKTKRINGSHHIYARTSVTARISVPVHGNKPLKSDYRNTSLKLVELINQNCKNAKYKANAFGQ